MSEEDLKDVAGDAAEQDISEYENLENFVDLEDLSSLMDDDDFTDLEDLGDSPLSCHGWSGCEG